MKGMGNLMKMAQKAQSQILKLQEELAEKITEASSGGGMVTATVNGKQQVLSLTISPEVLEDGDTEMLQDLIVAAINEALRKSQEMMAAEMQKVTGGMNIPGLM